MEADFARDALEVAGDAVITVDAGGHITSWNRHAEQLLGHPADQAVGQTLALIIPEQYRPRHVAGFHAATTAGALAHGGRPARVRAQSGTGETVTLVMSLGLLSDQGTGPAGVIAVLRPAGVPPVPFVESSDVPEDPA